MTMLIVLALIAAAIAIAAAGPLLAEQAKRNAEIDRDTDMEVARIQATGMMLVAHNRRMAALDRQQIPGGFHVDHCARCGRALMSTHDPDPVQYCAECDGDPDP